MCVCVCVCVCIFILSNFINSNPPIYLNKFSNIHQLLTNNSLYLS